jgi:hypothetical protein
MDKQIPMLTGARMFALLVTLCLYGIGMVGVGAIAVEFTRTLLQSFFGEALPFWRAAWISLANPICWVFVWYAGKSWHQLITWVISQIYKR